MSDAIGVGDWVECLEVGSCDPTESGGYEVGGIYRVSDVHIYFDEAQLNCVGCVRPEEFGLPDPGWDADCFRPIRSDITSITRLLTEPIPSELVDQ